MQEEQIEKAIRDGYSLNAQEYFSKGYDLFSKNPLGYIGFFMVQILFSMVAGIIPLLKNISDFVITPVLTVGFYTASDDLKRRNNDEFGNYFKGFNFFLRIFMSSLITFLMMMLIFSPMLFIFGSDLFDAIVTNDYYEMYEQIGEALMTYFWLIIILVLILFYCIISFRWANLLIVFHDYTVVDAFKTSWRLINANFMGHFGFLLMCILVGILGLLALGIGLIIAIPLIYIADFLAYAEVTKLFKTDAEIEEIGLE